jgi:Intracellular proteinase inhibitor
MIVFRVAIWQPDKMRFLFPFVFIFSISAASAIDVDASKKNQPEQFINPAGNKPFSLFSGDPKRIQNANTINFNDFEKKIEVTPGSLSLKEARALGTRPALKVVFTLKNNGRKTYVLSFPNAQRYDILIKDSTGQSLYTWSEDKEFVAETGSTLVNNSDKITFVENIALCDFTRIPEPGAYTVEAVLNNYPELHAKTPITIIP